MKPIQLQPAAKLDLAEADTWYEEQLPGSGNDLLLEFSRTTARIAEYPESFVELDPGVHRAMLRRFPYHVVYVIEPTTIEVIAVLHARRHPSSWKRRLP